MSKLKKPVGFFEQDKSHLDNTQKAEITAKRLDVEDARSLRDQEVNRLGDEDSLQQNVQGTKSLSDQDIKRLDVQETGKLDDKTANRQNGQTSKRQDAEKLNTQTPQRLDAIPLDVRTPSQPEVELQNTESSEQQVDKTLKLLSDKETKLLDAEPQDGETPKKKKAKSVSLVKKTYYIDHDLDGAIELMAVLQKGDQSDIVRQLLRSAIPEYYLTQWKLMSDHSK